MKKKNCSSSPGRVLVLECLAVSADRLMYPARGCSTHSGRWGVHPLRLTMDSSAPARALRGAPSSSPGRARLGAGHQKSGMTGGRHKYLLGSTAVWPLKVRRRNKAPSQDSCTRHFSALLHLCLGHLSRSGGGKFPLGILKNVITQLTKSVWHLLAIPQILSNKH